jgi:hypothetical protein
VAEKAWQRVLRVGGFISIRLRRSFSGSVRRARGRLRRPCDRLLLDFLVHGTGLVSQVCGCVQGPFDSDERVWRYFAGRRCSVAWVAWFSGGGVRMMMCGAEAHGVVHGWESC